MATKTAYEYFWFFFSLFLFFGLKKTLQITMLNFLTFKFIYYNFFFSKNNFTINCKGLNWLSYQTTFKELQIDNEKISAQTNIVINLWPANKSEQEKEILHTVNGVFGNFSSLGCWLENGTVERWKPISQMPNKKERERIAQWHSTQLKVRQSD